MTRPRLHYHLDRARVGLGPRIEALCSRFTTYEEVAELADVNIRSLYRWRLGEAEPGWRELAKLAIALDCDLNWLVLGAEGADPLPSRDCNPTTN